MPASAGASALTAAERRVADLASSGLTNRQIARTLYLSPKTIEMHLRSSYRKLDLPGREHLAAELLGISRDHVRFSSARKSCSLPAGKPP